MTKEKSLEGKQKENFLGPTFLKFPGKVWADKINVLLSSVVVGELEDLYKEGVEREDLLEYMQTLPEFRELYKEMVKIAKDFSVEYVSVLKKRSKDDVGEMMKVISKFTETGASVRLYLKKNGNKDFVRSEVVSSFVEMFFQTALISALNVVYDKDQELGSSGFDALGNSVKTKAELKKLMLPAFTAIALQPPMSVMDFYKALGQLTKSLKGLGDVKLDEELLVYKNEIEVVKIDCLNGLEICIYPPNFFSKTESKINHSKAFVLVIKNKKDFPTDETMLSRVGRVTHPGFSFFGGYDQDSGTKFFGNNNFEDVMGAQEIQVSNPMFEPVERAIYLEFDTAVDDFLMLGTFVPVISEEGNLSGLISTEMYLSFKNAIFAKVNEMLLLAGVRRSEKNDKEERAAEELFVEEVQNDVGKELEEVVKCVAVEEQKTDKHVDYQVEDEKAGKKEKRVYIKGLSGNIVKERLERVCDDLRVSGSHHIFSRKVNGVKLSYPIPIHGNKSVRPIYIRKALEKLQLSVEEFLG